MNITIAVPGRLHAFETAAELAKRGHLRRVITPLPPWRVRKHSRLAPGYFASVPQHAAYRLLMGRFSGALWRESLDSAVFDWSASALLPRNSDLCVGYAGSCLRTLRRAHRLGAKAVVERHSAHRRVQIALLQEEHDRLGLPFSHDEAVMRRELLEYAEADAIIVPSRFVERTFLELGFAADKLVRVPLGADLSRFFPGPREDRRFRVAFAGTFSVRKGVTYLLQAWRRLALPQAELCFFGSVEADLLTRLNPDAVPGVRMFGPLSQERLREQLSQCDVLVLPSIEDGFGLVMAQAMACGLPVLHSANTGGADLVRPGVDGFEFPIRDAEAIAVRLEQLYRDRNLCAEMGQQGLAQVKMLGGWNDYGERLTAAYQRLVGESS